HHFHRLAQRIGHTCARGGSVCRATRQPRHACRRRSGVDTRPMNTLTAISPADTAADASMVALEWLLRAHRARVYDVAHESTLADAPWLAASLDRRVLLKREDEQPVFSFKLRGAYNRMVKLDPAERARGVVT